MPPNDPHDSTALTVEGLMAYMEGLEPDTRVVLSATLADGSVISVNDVTVGTDQGGPDGEGFVVVVSWEPGAEIVTR